MKVLLIENQPSDAELAQRLLLKGPHPCDVEWVETIGLGLERLKKGGIDVVLLDLGLSDSQGLNGVNRVKAQAPDVPVVVLTGSYEDDSLAVQALQGGAQDYLMKDGLNGKLLSRAIRYAIERKRSEEQLRKSLAELERFNQLAVGREQRMIELKRQVNELSQALGKPPPHNLDFPEGAAS